MSDQQWVPPGTTPVGPPPGSSVPPPHPPSGGSVPPGAAPPPPASGPYRAADFRPGIVALRPLTLGDLYGGVLKAVRGNPGATIGLATLTTFVFLLPTTALGTLLAGQSSFSLLDEGSSAASDTLPDGFGLGILGLYLPAIGQALSAILLAGFLAQVVGQAVLGRKVGLGETWRATRGRILAMVGAVLVATIAALLVLAVAVGIPVGIVVYAEAVGGNSTVLAVLLILVGALVGVVVLAYLATAWAFATPSIVLDRTGVIGALRRSTQLVGSPLKGPFWRVFGIRLLTGIIVGFASSVITFPVTLLLFLLSVAITGDDGSGSGLFVLQVLSTGVSGLITGALTTPFSAGVDALLYVDARIRREGLDVRLVQAAQGAAEPPWPLTSP